MMDGPEETPSREPARPELSLVVLREPEQPRRRSSVRPFSWLLLFLLLITGFAATQVRKPASAMHIVDAPPPIEAPTGKLLDAFEAARPATVRIESRCGRRTLGVGSGFFVSADGMVLTAYHVVDASGQTACANVRYVAVTADRSTYYLDMVGFDAYRDLAALKAQVDGAVPYLALAQRAPATGSHVVAIGNSRNDFLGARAGRVTRLGVQANRADFADDTMELTNSLAPGDSGGPVVNDRGEAVGVVSFISFNPGAMSTQTFIPPFLRGLTLTRDYASYAVPLTLSSELVTAVLSGESRDLPVIGFSWAQFDYRPGRGAHDFGPRPGPVVNQVQPGSPADLAGLQSQSQEVITDDEGNTTVVPLADVIVAIDGVPTPSYYDLLAQIKSKHIGEVVTLTVQRANATYRVELELGAKTAVFADR